MQKYKDLTGKRFGRWNVIEESGRNKDGRVLWRCLCDCGAEKKVASKYLLNGDSKSCGCYKIEKTSKNSKKHGKTNEKLYNIWKSIRQRCNNKNSKSYKNYGGRGITYCEEWEEFENFYNWSTLNGYYGGLSIDRIDNNGPYAPWNCRWATPKEQANNKRRNRVVTYKGKNYTVSELAKETGINYRTIIYRLNRGFTVEKALFKGRIKNITYKGETNSIKYWSDKTGIEHSTLCRRIRSGWTIEDALTTPSRKKKLEIVTK